MPALSKLAILILAAGKASRMGEAKQLLSYQNTTLLGHAISQAKATKANTVYCVLGARAAIIESEIQNDEVNILINPDWEQGLASSVAAGIKQLKTENFDYILVMLADQPKIDTAFLNLLIDTALAHENTCIASGYGHKNGVPAVFPKSYFEKLEQLSGDSGARELLNSGADFIQVVDAQKKIQDIDTPEDYERLLKK